MTSCTRFDFLFQPQVDGMLVETIEDRCTGLLVLEDSISIKFLRFNCFRFGKILLLKHRLSSAFNFLNHILFCLQLLDLLHILNELLLGLVVFQLCLLECLVCERLNVWLLRAIEVIEFLLDLTHLLDILFTAKLRGCLAFTSSNGTYALLSI